MLNVKIYLPFITIAVLMLKYCVHSDCLGKYTVIRSQEYREVPFFQIDGFDTRPTEVTWQNNGQTVVINYTFAENRPSITAGVFRNETFRLEFMYYDWLNASYRNRNLLFPAKLHVVFVNERFANYQEAIRKNLAIAVFTYKHTVVENDYEHALETFYEPINKIFAPNTEHTVPGLKTPYLFNIIDIDRVYITYIGKSIFGSETKCGGDVIWIQFIATLEIKKKEIEVFKKLMSSNNSELISSYKSFVMPRTLILRSISPYPHFERNWSTYPFDGYYFSYDSDAEEYLSSGFGFALSKIFIFLMLFYYILLMHLNVLFMK